MLNFPPGAMDPEFHALLFAVDVCAVVSLLVQVTVPPTATVTGLGAYAVVVIVVAPLTIDTAVPGVVGEGVGDGDGDGIDEYEDPPQPIERQSKAPPRAIRTFM